MNLIFFIPAWGKKAFQNEAGNPCANDAAKNYKKQSHKQYSSPKLIFVKTKELRLYNAL